MNINEALETLRHMNEDENNEEQKQNFLDFAFELLKDLGIFNEENIHITQGQSYKLPRSQNQSVWTQFKMPSDKILSFVNGITAKVKNIFPKESFETNISGEDGKDRFFYWIEDIVHKNKWVTPYAASIPLSIQVSKDKMLEDNYTIIIKAERDSSLFTFSEVSPIKRNHFFAPNISFEELKKLLGNYWKDNEVEMSEDDWNIIKQKFIDFKIKVSDINEGNKYRNYLEGTKYNQFNNSQLKAVARVLSSYYDK